MRMESDGNEDTMNMMNLESDDGSVDDDVMLNDTMCVCVCVCGDMKMLEVR